MKTLYRIYRDNDPCELEQTITEKIAFGWKPIGGVAVASYVANSGSLTGDRHLRLKFKYAQAMIKEATND